MPPDLYVTPQYPFATYLGPSQHVEYPPCWNTLLPTTRKLLIENLVPYFKMAMTKGSPKEMLTSPEIHAKFLVERLRVWMAFIFCVIPIANAAHLQWDTKSLEALASDHLRSLPEPLFDKLNDKLVACADVLRMVNFRRSDSIFVFPGRKLSRSFRALVNTESKQASSATPLNRLIDLTLDFLSQERVIQSSKFGNI